MIKKFEDFTDNIDSVFPIKDLFVNRESSYNWKYRDGAVYKTFSGVETDIPRDGLFAEYLGDINGDTVVDNTGNYNGTVYGVSQTDGIIGNGILFRGHGEYVDLPDINVNYSNGFSFSGWVLFERSITWARIFAFGNGASADNINVCQIDDDKPTLRITSYNGASASSVVFTDSIMWGQWIHVGATIDGSGNAKLYINGSQVGSTGSINAVNTTNRVNNYLGKSNWSNDYFVGKMSLLRFYNKELSSDEIEQLYNEVPVGIRVMNGIKIWYTFDNVSGSTIYNEIVNRYNGTKYNGAWWSNGVFGQAFQMQPSPKGYVKINDFDFVGDKMSISCWFRTSNSSVYIATMTGTNVFSVGVNSGNLGIYKGGWYNFGSFSSDLKWHHVVFVVDGDQVKAYLNGTQSGNVQTVSGIDLSGVTNFYINDPGTGYNDCFIDDFKVFDRALNYDEIAELYNSQGYLTRIELNLEDPEYGISSQGTGFEDETDSDGGSKITGLTKGGNVSGYSSKCFVWYSDIDTDNKIRWSERYNYRIGAANIYRIYSISLWKDGVKYETQAASFPSRLGSLTGGNYYESHGGYNIDPNNRNNTNTGTAAGVGYPK